MQSFVLPPENNRDRVLSTLVALFLLNKLAMQHHSLTVFIVKTNIVVKISDLKARSEKHGVSSQKKGNHSNLIIQRGSCLQLGCHGRQKFIDPYTTASEWTPTNVRQFYSSTGHTSGAKGSNVSSTNKFNVRLVGVKMQSKMVRFDLIWQSQGVNWGMLKPQACALRRQW